MTAVPAPPSYERSPVREGSLEDLDLVAFRAWAERRAPRLAAELPDEALVQRLGLGVASGRAILPTVAGLYVFGTLPQLLRPEWGLSLVRVDGPMLADPLRAREDLEGPLAELLAGGLAFVAAHSAAAVDQVGGGPATPEYPPEAVREALANALIHRDLRTPARPAVHLFEDRLEIWNPGAPPARYPLDELARMGGVSLPRNPLVAATARSLGLVDQLGRGLPTIRRAVEGAPESARFLVTDTDVRLVIPSALLTPGPGLGTQ